MSSPAIVLLIISLPCQPAASADHPALPSLNSGERKSSQIGTANQPGEALISLEELRARVAERYNAVKTVRVQYRVLHKQFDPRAENRLQHDGLEDEVFTWYRSGAREKVVRDAWANVAGKPATPLLASFDGKTGYEAGWWPDGKRMSIMVRTPEIPHHLLVYAPRFMIGERLPGYKMTVEELLRRNNVRLAGVEEVTGQLCQVVDLGTEQLPNLGLHRARVWYDLSHGASLRKATVTQESSDSQSGFVRYSSTVGEFQEIYNPLTRANEWWPRSLYSRAADRTTVVYDSIVLNQPIPDSEFVPTLPPGVEISDRRNGREVRSSISGGDEGIAARKRAIEEFAPQRERLAPTPSALATAQKTGRPETSSSLPRWIFIASLGVLAVAVWLTWRCR